MALNKPIQIYRNVCPRYFIDDTVYIITKPSIPLIMAHNVRIVERKLIDNIVKNIRLRKGFTMARYNDGEWIAMLRIQDNKLYEFHSVKWGNSGQEFVDKNLTPIFDTIPPYLIGVSTEVLKKPYMTKHIAPYIIGAKLFDGGLFARWTLEGDITRLMRELQKRNVVLVGPAYCSLLQQYFDFTHVTTSESNVWESYTTTEAETLSAVEGLDSPVILYCCSFVAKKLIDVMYKKYTDSITQLDIGAAFDVYCNVNSRPWHEHMGKKLQLRK